MAARKPRLASARPSAAKPARAKAAKPDPKKNPRQPFRSGLVIRGCLIAGTLAAGATLAYIPVTQYVDLRGELAEAETEAEDLDEARQAAIARLTDSRRRNEERARCFNTWVEVGDETYLIQGLLTCDD